MDATVNQSFRSLSTQYFLTIFTQRPISLTTAEQYTLIALLINYFNCIQYESSGKWSIQCRNLEELCEDVNGCHYTFTYSCQSSNKVFYHKQILNKTHAKKKKNMSLNHGML